MKIDKKVVSTDNKRSYRERYFLWLLFLIFFLGIMHPFTQFYITEAFIANSFLLFSKALREFIKTEYYYRFHFFQVITAFLMAVINGFSPWRI